MWHWCLEIISVKSCPWSMYVQKFLPSMRNLKLLGWFFRRVLLKYLATRTMRGKERIFCTDGDLARKSRFFLSPQRLSKQCSNLEGREAIFFRFNDIADLWYTRLGSQTFIGIYRAKQEFAYSQTAMNWRQQDILAFSMGFLFYMPLSNEPKGWLSWLNRFFSINSCRTFLVLCNICKFDNQAVKMRKCFTKCKYGQSYYFLGYNYFCVPFVYRGQLEALLDFLS